MTRNVETVSHSWFLVNSRRKMCLDLTGESRLPALEWNWTSANDLQDNVLMLEVVMTLSVACRHAAKCRAPHSQFDMTERFILDYQLIFVITYLYKSAAMPQLRVHKAVHKPTNQ